MIVLVKNIRKQINKTRFLKELILKIDFYQIYIL